MTAEWRTTRLWQETRAAAETVSATIDSVDAAAVAAIVSAPGVRRVIATGNGAAYYAAVALWLAALEGGTGPEVVAAPAGLLARGSFRWRDGDVLLAFSSSGEMRDVIEALAHGAPKPFAAITSTPGSTIGSGAAALAQVTVASQDAVTHTQAFCGNVAAALLVWAEATGDDALREAVGHAPAAYAGACATAETWVDELEVADPAAAVVFGTGPAWAAALEGALLLKEVALIPTEGVETREGATSAMYALASDHLVVSLPAGEDPLIDEAERVCRRARRDRPACPRRRARRQAARSPDDVPGLGRPCCQSRRASRARRRPAGLDRRLLRRRPEHPVSLGLGILGCGSVFAGPYASMIDRLAAHGRVHVSAVYDVDEGKRHGAATRYGVDPSLTGPDALITRDDVDVVLVLTSMVEHGQLTRTALETGKHVLVEKPLATTLGEARALVELSHESPGLLICAPHIVLSPTFRAIHECRAGRRDRRPAHRAGPVRVGRPVVGRLVLPTRWRLALRPRGLQRDHPVRALRVGPAGHGDGGNGDPDARGQRSGGRGQG